jgi:hypothetical protein
MLAASSRAKFAFCMTCPMCQRWNLHTRAQPVETPSKLESGEVHPRTDSNHRLYESGPAVDLPRSLPGCIAKDLQQYSR